ncbi:xanthine dehydrogenase family protein molybdopterin-binding subunit [Noviherbaspirillum galbum]|uniref:Xanthine dehydrogenase family protein molybdopterin-binding subunit n=1 Tax=Noviherbaspirillum galbum TaxID=2709383 RepID=A0A6B3SMP6_9BURK|nr:xanthine dehydrogenase family protein molybdopterin-binding subunit [Noviherbaspirillum galbum]NEX62124.1 xanthine dehydrogenase family protein molybdopterin-binding subunit [Noviherbaspirillum galbum]
MKQTGLPMNRVDGEDKVCGTARYAAEFTLPRLAHAVMVQSPVASGRILAIDGKPVAAMPGVLAVLTHENAMKLPKGGKAAVQPPQGRVLSLLQDDAVHYAGQPVAVVVAETLEQATAAAAALRIRYERRSASLSFAAAKGNAYSPGKIQESEADTARGDASRAASAAAKRVDLNYATPMEHHNPMEPHATLATWNGDHLTLYDSTQHVAGVQKTIAKTFGMQASQVRVRNLFVGGGFGGKGSAWSHVALAAMAARHTGRPVRLVLQRPQLFGPVGGRPRTEQVVKLAADGQGRLAAIEHRAFSNTSAIEDWTESCALVTRMLYACPNVATSHRLVKLNVGTPTFQRAPGEATGSFALESAMDELAAEAGIDPLRLRLLNYADTDLEKRLPYSSKALRACYETAAERFGWARRDPRPRSMRQGQWLVGMGMGTATRPAKRSPAAASVKLTPDGQAVVRSSTEDLGTGTYTVMTQIAADALGYAPGKVRFELGDTDFPEAPVSAGSMTVESVGSAVHAACQLARHELVRLACRDPLSPLSGASLADVRLEDGWLRHADGKRAEPASAAIARAPGAAIEASADSKPGDETERYSMHSFGAVFCEAHVDPELGIVRVPRVVGAYGVGTVINAKTAHSQIMGGIVWGISQALHEESLLDERYGRFVNANLAEYHIPVNADIGDIDITFVPETDPHVNAIGAKGLGEVGMTGVAGAIANAVYHATGKRIRELPIRLDKLL